MKKNKKLKFISLIFLSFFVLFCQTIVYSAINSTMSIRGDAYARAEADVRITDFRLASATNATSSFEEFGKTHVITELDLTDATSSITYYVEITNYGSVDVGIFDITGLPDEVNYSIKDYNLHDKICDDTGKCNNFAKKTLELTLTTTTTSTYTGSIQLDFDFRTYHTITYTDITNNNYPTEVIDGGNLNITFTGTLKRVQVLSNNTELGYYTSILSGQTISFNNITNDVEVKIKNYVAKLVSGELNEVGSEVCIGEECFYIISNDGTIVTMLAKYNLHVGYTMNNLEQNGMRDYNLIENPTGIQHEAARGWIDGEFSWIGISEFNPETGNLEYSDSTIKLYVDDYSNYLTSIGITPINARIINMDELINLGCSDNSCSEAPDWIYYTTYWTNTNMTDSWEPCKYIVFSDGRISYIEPYSINNGIGVRPVIELDVDEIQPLLRIESGDLDTVGSELCISDECFYVISSDDNSTTMIAKYNLYVGGSYDENTKTWTAYGEEATGKQDKNMLGYSKNRTVYRGVTPYSSDDQKGTYYTTYSGSIVEGYVNNYKNIIESEFGLSVEEARLITYDELQNSETFACSSEGCSNKYPFIYSTVYWTGSAYGDASNIYTMDAYEDYSFIYISPYSNFTNYGVRPVITIPKWTFSNKIKFTISGGTYYAKEGMTWEEWVNSQYNPTEALVQPDLCSNDREYRSNGYHIKNTFNDTLVLNSNLVSSTDIIINGAAYVID